VWTCIASRKVGCLLPWKMHIGWMTQPQRTCKQHAWDHWSWDMNRWRPTAGSGAYTEVVDGYMGELSYWHRVSVVKAIMSMPPLYLRPKVSAFVGGSAWYICIQL
jgi:hypothetical protein